MNQHGPQSIAPVATSKEKLSGRRRVAPKIIESSDVTRFHGVLAAGALGLVGVAGAVALSLAMGQEVGSSKPLERPHIEAALQCDQCHGVADLEPKDACGQCHGQIQSVRTGHAALIEAGTLRCIDCHHPHYGNGGVTLTNGPDGASAIRYGPGAEKEVEIETRFRLEGVLNVPSPPAATCARCHDIDDVSDPVATCFLAGQEELGGARPSVCFDEHRTIRGTDSADHVAAWDVARVVLAESPRPPAGGSSGAGGSGGGGPSPIIPVGWLGSGLALGLMGFLTTRTIRARKRRPKRRDVKLDTAALLPTELKKLPQINTATCIGCNACVDACPYDVLEVRSYVAFVARPDDCCGLTLCEQRCPNGSLVITEGDPVEDRPGMDDTLQSTDSPGVYLAGDLTGLPLIRNAINQGSWVMKTVAKSLPQRGRDQHDVVIIGAGPAGLAASLEAKAQGLNYITLEQGGVAESIRSFPRGKLVFDQPLGVPLVGDLWLSESSKEELLSQWMRILEMHSLEIRENMRVTAIHRISGGPPHGSFQVDFVDPNGHAYAITGSRIVLACGRRGTPRKLPIEIPVEAQNQVHYSLADARSFAGARVMVVGLGDVAMEAAIGLAGQTGTRVYLSYRGDDFKRGKRRNMEEIKRLADAGRIELLFETNVAAVQPGRVWLQGAGAPQGREIEFDALFVMVGNIAPWDFLSACGVNRVKVESSTEVT